MAYGLFPTNPFQVTLVYSILVAWAIALILTLIHSVSGDDLIMVKAKDNAGGDFKSYPGGPANHFVGIVSDGGSLHMLPDKLFFHPHAFNIHHDDVSIPYDIIVNARAGGLNFLYVDLIDGKTEKFVVYHKEQWVSDIKERMAG